MNLEDDDCKYIEKLNDKSLQSEHKMYLYEQYRSLVMLVLSAYQDGMNYIPLGNYLESLLALKKEDVIASDVLVLQSELQRDLKIMCEILGYFRDETNAYGNDVYVRNLT